MSDDSDKWVGKRNSPRERSRLILPPAVDRRTFIGGSDAPGIVGLSPWRTPLEVWQSKVELRTEDVHPIERQRVLDRGKRLEPYVVDMLEDEHGVQVVERNRRHVDPQHPFIAAEVDFEYWDRETRSLENGEIKTVSPFKAKEWGEQQTDEVPIHYCVQALHGLMVTGRNRTLMGVLIGGDDFRVYRVVRDDEAIAGLREKELEFWNRVQTLDPPEPRTSDDILRMFARDAGTSIEATGKVLEDVLHLRDLREGIAVLEERADEITERLKIFMGEHARLTVDGKDVITWKTQTARKFDVARFRKEAPELANDFTRVVASRVFRIK